MSSNPTRDGWDGAVYSANADHHRRHDAGFLQSISLSRADAVLDLGCGTGEFTRKLAALVPDGRVLGVDASTSQIEVALSDPPGNAEFVVARAQDLDAVLGAR